MLRILSFLNDILPPNPPKQEDTKKKQEQATNNLICLHARGNTSLQNGGVLSGTDIARAKDRLKGYQF